MIGKRAVLCVTILVGVVLALELTSACAPLTQAPALQSVAGQDPLPVAVVSAVPMVSSAVERVNRERALTDLRRLTGDEPICAGPDCVTIGNRLTNSEGLRWATDYVFNTLASLGYAVSYQEWSRDGYSDRNVIARKPGTYAPAEEVYFIAHVDGVGPDAGVRSPAADDDATGVVANLEMARILSSQTFSRTLVLLFTTGEEQGTLGARSHLQQLSASELASIRYAVNVEMLGYDANRDGVMELWHAGEAPSIAVTKLMSETIAAYHLGLAPRLTAGCG